MTFDCIVVGAGPAGASAAYHLAKRGRSVILLEKQALPRYKPCAGGVSPEVAQWFDFDFSPAISCKVENLRYTWKLDDPVEAHLEATEPMWMVQRDVFDYFLVQQAQAQGVELRDNTTATGIEFKDDRWHVNTANGTIEARYLIAADGAAGSMRQWLGFKQSQQRTGVILESPTAGLQPTIAKFEFGMVKNGYISSFPKGDRCSIAGATFRGSEPSDLRAVMASYSQKMGVNPADCQQFVQPLCLWDGNQKLHTQNALLAGEAACMVDPLIAEGVRPAMFTGVKAAEAIDQALFGNLNALENYTQLIHDKWGAEMLWAQRIAGAFYRFPGLSYKKGIKRPTATTAFGQILCGQLRYSDIANKAISRLSGGLIPGMG
ncbi:geranylgeranyl reductase family protein [Leptolyngbyaceae cyanobacterium UHCC 1019]